MTLKLFIYNTIAMQSHLKKKKLPVIVLIYNMNYLKLLQFKWHRKASIIYRQSFLVWKRNYISVAYIRWLIIY